MQTAPKISTQDFPSLEAQPNQGQYKGYDFYTQYPSLDSILIENKKKREQLKELKKKIEEERKEQEEKRAAEKKKQEEKNLVEFQEKAAQINPEFSDIEQTRGKTLYASLLDKVCDVNTWKRVLREVRDVNNDFHSLRACIGVVADVIGVLHFLLYPSDGAIADKSLCGRILIPKGYPKMAPVVHMSTRTNRKNVDIFHYNNNPANLDHLMYSSMCFDILKPKSHGGTWEPEFTLSALIASLLQAIVSVRVPQKHGGEVEEFVSMEKLSSIHQNVESTYSRSKAIMPSRKEITHIEPIEVKTKYFRLPEKITSPSHSRSLIIKSNRIFLQDTSRKMRDNVYSIGFDLSDLKNNPATVFSIILSNSPYDPVGKKPETILIRNGVTATAAKKRFGTPIEWFYHGKPMNESNLRVIVTVGYNQFCISYYVDGDRKVIHGDCPVSFLTPAEIGNVDNEEFYLSVFLKNKGGLSVTVRTFIPECGCVHPVAGDIHERKCIIKNTFTDINLWSTSNSIKRRRIILEIFNFKEC